MKIYTFGNASQYNDNNMNQLQYPEKIAIWTGQENHKASPAVVSKKIEYGQVKKITKHLQ